MEGWYNMGYYSNLASDRDYDREIPMIKRRKNTSVCEVLMSNGYDVCEANRIASQLHGRYGSDAMEVALSMSPD